MENVNMSPVIMLKTMVTKGPVSLMALEMKKMKKKTKAEILLPSGGAIGFWGKQLDVQCKGKNLRNCRQFVINQKSHDDLNKNKQS